MNVLFWAEPHFALSQISMDTWTAWFDKMGASLRAADLNSDYRIAAFGPVSAQRSDNYGSRLIEFDQGELRAAWAIDGDSFLKLENDTEDRANEEHLCAMLQSRLEEFQPTHILLLNQQPWLRRLFPNAAFINIELAWMSRAPFPQFWHLDTCGAGKGRALADYPALLTEGGDEDWSAEAQDLSQQVAMRFSEKSAQQFVLNARREYALLTLLPLGIYRSYDGRTSLFAALDKYLGECDVSTAYIITQHPLVPVLSDTQLGYLCAKHSHVIDGSRYSSQSLILLVDAVVGDFSTIATQALFGQTKIITITEHLEGIPSASPLLNPLAPMLARATHEERARILRWMISRYIFSAEQIFNGIWLRKFLMAAVDATALAKPASIYRAPWQERRDWQSLKWRHESENGQLVVGAEAGGASIQQLLDRADKLHGQNQSASAVDLVGMSIRQGQINMVRATERLVWYCIGAGHFDNGLDASDYLLRLEDKADYYWQRSHLLESAGRRSEAISAARAAVLRAPMNSRFRAHLVTLLLSDQQLDNAERHILIARTQSPEDAVVQHRLSLLRSHQGRLDEAHQAARNAVSLAPQNQDFAQHLKNVEERLLSPT